MTRPARAALRSRARVRAAGRRRCDDRSRRPSKSGRYVAGGNPLAGAMWIAGPVPPNSQSGGITSYGARRGRSRSTRPARAPGSTDRLGDRQQLVRKARRRRDGPRASCEALEDEGVELRRNVVPGQHRARGSRRFLHVLDGHLQDRGRVEDHLPGQQEERDAAEGVHIRPRSERAASVDAFGCHVGRGADRHILA